MCLLLGLMGAAALAENIDPIEDGSQYAYAENVGWINAEPLGHGGLGVQVDDFVLTGWMWAENVGWLSLSCNNTLTCGIVSYGISNDGSGVLSGFAWAENVGWINFAPSTAGVSIDVATGEFSGRAWGENIGWITFASAGPFPFKVKTSWVCDPPPGVPSGSPDLSCSASGSDTDLSWSLLGGATGCDIVGGDIGVLRSSGGDFSLSTQTCLDDNNTTEQCTASDDPALGEAFWFLVRGANCGGNGTYDTGAPSQVGLRDAEIAASGNDCS
jgi:hypothetical protein